MDGFCYLAVDTKALYFDGWCFSLSDDGLWRTWQGFGNGYLLGAFQTKPTMQLIQWRSFIRIGFDCKGNSVWRNRYSQYRNTDGEMNKAKAFLDKSMPVRRCVQCRSCITIDAYICSECDYPAFPCTWVQSSWIILAQVRILGLRMESKVQSDAIYRYCIDQCKRLKDEPERHRVGEKWDPDYYSLDVIPLNHINECSAIDAEKSMPPSSMALLIDKHSRTLLTA